MLQLEFPNMSHKQSCLDMIQEWRSFEKIPTSPTKLFAGEDFKDFIERVTTDITNNPRGVNAHVFFLIDDISSKILGAIQIRHHINHPELIETVGHIGYDIRPSERKKGYATEMLRLALPEAKKIGLWQVLITCYDDNIASVKVIENNGGIFERFTEKEGKKLRRYWITL